MFYPTFLGFVCHCDDQGVEERYMGVEGFFNAAKLGTFGYRKGTREGGREDVKGKALVKAKTEVRNGRRLS